MSSLNKAMIIGRLGDQVDLRYTKSNIAVANLSVATSDKYKDQSGEWKEQTEWHRVVLWGKTAEVAQKYLSKGSKVYIEGSLQTRKWEDKEGNTKYTTEIKGRRMLMLDSKEDTPERKQETADSLDSSEDLSDMEEQDDLPF